MIYIYIFLTNLYINYLYISDKLGSPIAWCDTDKHRLKVKFWPMFVSRFVSKLKCEFFQWDLSTYQLSNVSMFIDSGT